MAAAGHDHKVRGGSALSIALTRVSPALDASAPDARSQSSPTDSGVSSTLAGTPQQGSDGVEWPPPAPRLLMHSAGTGPTAAAAAAAASRGERRRRPSFLSCFGGSRVVEEEATQPAVSASEVGIRPCFYWLESPVSEKDRMFAEANARWLKSDCQDDAVVIEHFGGAAHQTFAGVFDGHGPYGRNAAKYTSTRLPQLLAAKAGGSAGGGSERRRLRALRESFLEVDAGMRDMGQAGFDASLSGTTACCALLVGRKVIVASTGDSRCVVARRGSAGELEVVPLTWDAKPSVPEEQKRIAMSGGVVKQLLDERGERVGAFRVFQRGDDVLPGLAMSRSLGDLYAHEVGVSPEPVINTYSLGDRDLFVILATDGLWDIMNNEEAADFVERYKTRRELHLSCAEALTLEAQERWKALHDEAIVDDISCVILHTAGLPPPERDASVPRPLARAASCNDEANELYLQWRLEKERNPSNHKPKQYFKHLYGDELGKEGSRSSGGSSSLRPASAPVAGSRLQDAAAAAPSSAMPGAPAAALAAAAVRGGTPPPPASPNRQDAPQYESSLSRHTSCLSSPNEDTLGALPSPTRHSTHGGMHGTRRGGGGDVSSQSPHSSFGDLASENSEQSMRRGSAFSGAGPPFPAGPWGGNLPDELTRRSSGPQPIPAKGVRAAPEGVAQSLPLDVLLRPVRKAYPSSGNMQQLHGSYGMSYRSDGSGLWAGDTPRSGDSNLEHKVRGGMSRSLSHASGALANAAAGRGGFSSHASLPTHPSNASLHSAGRSSLDMRGSVPASPSGDSLLTTTLSPQQSPVVVPLGAGYSRVFQVASGGRVHSLAPLGGISGMMQHPPAFGAQHHSVHASLEVRADLVARGSHLSRRTTDTAGLAEAMYAIDEAAGSAARSCAAAVAAAAAVSSHHGSPASH